MEYTHAVNKFSVQDRDHGYHPESGPGKLQHGGAGTNTGSPYPDPTVNRYAFTIDRYRNTSAVGDIASAGNRDPHSDLCPSNGDHGSYIYICPD
jgi:hypothetical protein